MSTNTLATDSDSSAIEDRRALLLRGPVVSTLFKLTVPVIAVVVTQTFVAILEAYWVSRLGTEAVAGVSLVLPILILMGTMSNGGIGGGVSAAVARAIGADRRADANALLLHAVAIAFAFGFAFTLGTIFLAPRLYSSLGGHGQTLEFASNGEYVRARFRLLRTFRNFAISIKSSIHRPIARATKCSTSFWRIANPVSPRMPMPSRSPHWPAIERLWIRSGAQGLAFCLFEYSIFHAVEDCLIASGVG